MHLHFERNSNAKCDCAILSLTWMGKVPDELPEDRTLACLWLALPLLRACPRRRRAAAAAGLVAALQRSQRAAAQRDEGWKLNRTNYYQEGWLATGNIRGIVGVTFTTSHCKKSAEFPLRTNYNLRGHRSEVILVKWNEPYQKLASCDSSGIIFVWIKYEGRWSIELINDRNTPVTHFSWSHDGRMALICYQDGFVLVGSVAGQRYWSSMLNLDSTITCGIWTPDDQQVYFGTTSGQIIVMDVHGAMVSQVQLGTDVGITSMAWSCEKFKMEEGDDSELGGQSEERIFILAVSLQNGYIFLMKSFDDVSPVLVHTGLAGPLCIEWSNSRELLAVAGTVQQHGAGAGAGGASSSAAASGEAKTGSVEYINMLKFYSETGVLLYSIVIPYTQSPVTALTWGHNDKRLFVATGCQVHIAWVSRRIASLQLMCRLRIHSHLRGGEAQVATLPLPPRIKALIANLFAQTIRCCVPETSALREFVSRPPSGSVRLHCTMIRHDDDTNLSSGTCYTLYLEYLGGLVPLLKGKRTSKIRPEFVIFDPQVDELCVGGADAPVDPMKSSGSSQNAASDTSDTEREDGCGSPRVQRRKRRRNKSHGGGGGTSGGAGGSGGNGGGGGGGAGDKAGDGEQDDLAYVDTLPEHIRLVEVTSNIWGTKFKIHGLASSVPANLGQVTYKTSLLHLQPRQMTLVITELRDDIPSGPDPNFNPNLFSEDEEEVFQNEENPRFPHGPPSDVAPPIAPMTPRAHHAAPSSSGRFTQARPKMAGQGPPPCITPCDMARAAKAAPSPGLQSCSESNPNAVLSVPALAKAESYEDEYPYVDLTDMVHFCESLRTNGASSTSPCSQSPTPKNYVESCACPQTSNGTTYSTNVNGSSNGYGVGSVTQFSRSSVPPGPTSTQTRHAISPLVCEGAVPTLQSPKNTVAPSDVIIERQPSPQTLVASNTTTDYAGNIQRVKTTLVESNHNRSPTGLNLNLGTANEQNANSIDLKPVVMKRMDVEGNNKLHQLINGSSIDTNASPDNNNLLSSNHVVSPNKGASNNNSINVGKRKERTSSSKSSPSGNQIGIAGGKWCLNKQEEIQFIDDDTSGESSEKGKQVSSTVSVGQHSPACLADSMVRSCSVGYLDLVDAQLVPCEVALMMLRKETPKRLVLVNQKKQKKHKNKSQQSSEGSDKNSSNCSSQPPKLKHCGKSKSLDSTDIFTTRDNVITKNPPSDSSNTQANANGIEEISKSINPTTSVQNSVQHTSKAPVTQTVTPILASISDTKNTMNQKCTPLNEIENPVEKAPVDMTLKNCPKFNGREDIVRDSPPTSSATAQVMASLANLVALESLTSRARDFDDTHSLPPPSPCSSPRLPRSSPASPAPSKKSNKRNQSSSPIRKHLLNSPLLNRRQRKNKNTESSDDEVVHSGDEVFNGKNYRDLESFQKAQLRQKLKRGKFKDGPESSSTPQSPRRREFVMHNKAPMWNENSQVYQLDFGGRVTQESAKNFQIEFRGKQVMQFGRIDGNAYTLDFQYPFSALQAFAVALANVTQRLK